MPATCPSNIKRKKNGKKKAKEQALCLTFSLSMRKNRDNQRRALHVDDLL